MELVEENVALRKVVDAARADNIALVTQGERGWLLAFDYLNKALCAHPDDPPARGNELNEIQ